MRTQKNKPGFTLVELLVVIAVIAILAGLLLPVLSKSRAHGQGAQCVNNLKQLATAIQMYADEHGRWPEKLSDIKNVPIPGDPFTGKAFGYSLSETTAILSSPPDIGNKYSAASGAERYELTLRSAPKQ